MATYTKIMLKLCGELTIGLFLVELSSVLFSGVLRDRAIHISPRENHWNNASDVWNNVSHSVVLVRSLPEGNRSWEPKISDYF